MKEKIIRMTAAEIRQAFDREKALAMAKAAPEYDGDPNPGGKFIGRGLAAFKEYIKGRPASPDPRRLVSLRLRSTGRGWQTRLSDYVERGASRGAFDAPRV
jgi:uncharacterized protein (DUF4415 family)